MNTPNKLTIFRILMVPFLVFFLMFRGIAHNALISLILFSIASITDLLDGYLARKHEIITNFGKFLDPLADKMLVTSVLICFVELGLASAVAVVIIIAREFMVTSLRLVASDKGVVIPANIWGKLKTNTQIAAIIVILLLQELNYVGWIGASAPLNTINAVCVWIACAATVASGIQYMWAGKKYLSEK